MCIKINIVIARVYLDAEHEHPYEKIFCVRYILIKISKDNDFSTFSNFYVKQLKKFYLFKFLCEAIEKGLLFKTSTQAIEKVFLFYEFLRHKKSKF